MARKKWIDIECTECGAVIRIKTDAREIINCPVCSKKIKIGEGRQRVEELDITPDVYGPPPSYDNIDDFECVYGPPPMIKKGIK